MSNTHYSPEFRIFKEGMTKGLVTIMSKKGEPFDVIAKIKFYISLGYFVFDLQGNQIEVN